MFTFKVKVYGNTSCHCVRNDCGKIIFMRLALFFMIFFGFGETLHYECHKSKENTIINFSYMAE